MSETASDPAVPFSLLIKPASADCNLGCAYCFYLPKARLYPGPRRMSRETLERLISSYMATEQPQYVFGWQGGEPALMGVEFFREVVRLQERHGKPGSVVANGLQTNATRITEELAALFARYRFLVGVSIDGPGELHDVFRTRPGGTGSFRQVVQGLELLRKHGVAFNALVAVSAANVGRTEEVYRFLVDRGILHHQYIPIVELDERGRPLPFTIDAEQWGRFLVRLFDLWYPDRYRVSVRHFDAVLARLVDGTETICTMGRDCRSYFLVEHNGDVYPCDFFVEPELRLGNIHKSDWRELGGSRLYREFGRRKGQLHPDCLACEYLELCAGDCLKNRIVSGSGAAASASALSWLCQGWKAFYRHALPGLRRLAREIQRQRSRALEESMRRDHARELQHPRRPLPTRR